MRALFLILFSFVLLSCDNSVKHNIEIENLQEQISILEIKNKQLNDSLSKTETDFLNSLILIGIPYSKTLKVGKKDSIVMLLQTHDRKLPKYEVYSVEDNREIKIGEKDKTRFNFEFTPKSIEDNSPELLIKLPHDGRVINIHGKLLLDVEK